MRKDGCGKQTAGSEELHNNDDSSQGESRRNGCTPGHRRDAEHGVPESFVFGTPDRYEEKDIGFVIQFMCKLGGMAQVIDPELPERVLDAPQTTQAPQSSDKRSNDGLVTDQSKDFST